MQIITALQKMYFSNTQLMNMITFYVFLAAESEFDNRFSPTRLYLVAQELQIFAFL